MSDPVSIKDATDAAVDVAADQVSGCGRDGVGGGLVADDDPQGEGA